MLFYRPLDAGLERFYKERVEAMLSGDITTGKAVLRDYINAAVGFRALSTETQIPSKSLMRMFGLKGNPSARRLFEVIRHLQKFESTRFEIRATR